MKYEVVDPIPEEIYLKSHDWSGATIYHTQAWHQVLQKTFGWPVQGLLGIDSGEIVAYLPFVRKRRLGKQVNIALPLSHQLGFTYKYGNFVSSDNTIDMLPLSNLEVHESLALQGAHPSYDNDSTVLDLSKYKNENELFLSLDKSSIRYMIQRAQKNNINVSCSVSDSQLNHLYALTIETRQRQGSPVYPKNFFYEIRNAFEEQFYLYIAYCDGRAVAASAFYHYYNTVIYGYSASINDRDIKRLGANELVMWNALCDAVKTGKSVMDFGTSPISNPGLRKFKEKWGGVSSPLLYTRIGKEKPVDRNSKSVEFVSKFLQRMPPSLFKTFSPYLLRMVV